MSEQQRPLAVVTGADPVLKLGQITYDKAGVKLTAADRAALVVEGEKLVTASEKAEPELYKQMSEVLMRIRAYPHRRHLLPEAARRRRGPDHPAGDLHGLTGRPGAGVPAGPAALPRVADR